ncbi:hypothetical protein V6Z11_D06G043400 [Gossypium hirsutum]|uniref:Membrane-anchored ubiquitin-fold protein 6-like n=1 Tax=Gossypium hirsutum TaxID=3635 RepID=A0ABM3A884_GOSHI|nr:membrane-anchored ubiquitin-fold protein 6-like [Gossypium hirsutum]
MAGEDLVELKFRLADGTDIGPTKYTPDTTIASLKEKILAQWPKDKENCPKTIQNVKLINAGKILENKKTLAESTLPVGELPGGVITMHVVLRLPLSDKNNEKQQDDSPKKSSCSCTILLLLNQIRYWFLQCIPVRFVLIAILHLYMFEAYSDGCRNINRKSSMIWFYWNILHFLCCF